MKKIAIGTALLLVVSLLFAGGPKEKPVQSTKTTIQIMGPWIVEPIEGVIFKNVVNAFLDKYPQYDVELIGVPSADVTKTVQAMATSGTLPDICIMNGGFNAAWKQMGIVEDISSSFTPDFLAGFYPEMLEEFKYNGELFGVPTCAAPFVFILRNDLLQAAGLKPPKNFEEIRAVSKALTKDSRYGLTLMGFPDGNTSLRFVVALFAAGAPDVYKDSNGKWATKIGSPESLSAFRLYWNTALVDNSVPKGSTEVDYKSMVNLLATDKAAMAISGPHTIGSIIDQNPKMEGKFIAIPLADKDTVAYLNSYGLIKFKGGKNPQGAIDFMKFAAENFTEMTVVTKRPPARKELGEVAKKSAPEVAAILNCADYAIDYVQIPFRNDVSNAIAEGVNAMLAGKFKSPEEAAESMRIAIQVILDKNNK